MQCLEVAVNGERLCVAGADHVAMLTASVTHGGLDEATDRDKTELSVHGMSKDLQIDYYWGKEKFAEGGGRHHDPRCQQRGARGSNQSPFQDHQASSNSGNVCGKSNEGTLPGRRLGRTSI